MWAVARLDARMHAHIAQRESAQHTCPARPEEAIAPRPNAATHAVSTPKRLKPCQIAHRSRGGSHCTSDRTPTTARCDDGLADVLRKAAFIGGFIGDDMEAAA